MEVRLEPKTFPIAQPVALTAALILLLALIAPRPSLGAVIGIDAVGGLPQMIGGEIRAFPSERKWHVGVGYGFFPIDGMLQRAIKLPSRDLGDGFKLTSHAEYSLTSFSTFIRHYPGARSAPGGFFLQFNYAYWNGSADAGIDLSHSSGLSILSLRNAVSGTISVTQHVLTLMAGHQFFLSKSLFIDVAGGIAYLLPVETSVEFNTQNSLLLSIVSAVAGANLADAKKRLTEDVDSKVKDFWGKYFIAPQLFIAIGFQF